MVFNELIKSYNDIGDTNISKAGTTLTEAISFLIENAVTYRLDGVDISSGGYHDFTPPNGGFFCIAEPIGYFTRSNFDVMVRAVGSSTWSIRVTNKASSTINGSDYKLQILMITGGNRLSI